MIRGNHSIKDAMKITGRSEWWLRANHCWECGTTILTAVRMGCQSDRPNSCDPEKDWAAENTKGHRND